ncbi:hypothetical protein [Paraglaciecola sp. L3A3]|uniref:hypothetical protein n=1 Tax=Paraglaciecola sp. L3A3 TaxID=2686358 RepID=UPI00131E85F7|nr:hypothetical protein [Paraglaciecola sp. L3A3]
MKKLIALGFLTMFTASQAQASFMTTITGIDMAGIEVTANFDGGTSQSFTWGVVDAGIGNDGTPVGLEAEIGGGEVANWFSLTQAGLTQGGTGDNGTPSDFSDDTYYGIWTLSNLSNMLLTSVVIDVMNTNVVFDTVFDDNGDGSDRGQPFITLPSSPSATGVYGKEIQDELFGMLTINANLDNGAPDIQFFADTDLKIAQDVSAPAALSLMLLGLGGLVASRRKKA